jgi:hypothetical protein
MNKQQTMKMQKCDEIKAVSLPMLQQNLKTITLNAFPDHNANSRKMDAMMEARRSASTAAIPAVPEYNKTNGK